MEKMLIEYAGDFLQPFGHRGLFRICKIIGTLGPKERRLRTEIAPNTKFIIDAKDPYWMRLLASSYRYEPEIGFVLRSIDSIDFTFLDAGANHGYWSLIASSHGKRCIAVEALESNYRRLMENVALNQQPIRTHLAAITDISGQTVHIASNDHQGAHVAPHGEAVETISIDDLLADEPPPFVLKLDIEGCEIPALKGASETLRTNPLIIYEDHGRETTHDTTRFIMEELGYSVFFIHRNKTVEKISKIDQLAAIKTMPHYGYNFFALSEKSEFNKFIT